MCGIAGFAEPCHDPAAAKAVAERMTDLIAYRGPDGAGFFADDRVALGHRRLSIIDLAGGGQPMLNETGSLVVVFNGEIYNYQELTAQLLAAGHSFATRSDTEVLLHGYEEWGQTLPARLRGMFAFAIWNRDTGTLFAARDPFGVKPFYYYQKGALLLFGSEIKCFLPHPGFEKRLNAARLPDVLSTEYLPDAETMFAGVYKLPGGHTLCWQGGQITIRAYQPLAFAPQPRHGLHWWAGRARRAFAGSVAAHQIADVEVGCFLSGGVDSALVACQAKANAPKVKTFSVGYAEGAYSELPQAEATARALGLPFTATTVTAEQFFAANEKIQWYLDEPMPNPAAVPLYFLCQAAAKQVKVVLSGEGADELFGGYPLYCQGVHAGRWQRLPNRLRRALGRAGERLPQGAPGRGFLRRGALPPWQRCARANYVFATPAERNKFLRTPPGGPGAGEQANPAVPANPADPAENFRPYFAAANGLDEATALQQVDLQTWLPSDILLKADRMSMAHSLELRVPFLDREVFAVAARLPRRYRCTARRTKIALRAAAAPWLPRSVAQRKKRGFPVPLAAWLRQEPWYSQVQAAFTGPVARQFFNVEALCRLLADHRAGKVQAMTQIWTFYSFIVWYNAFFVQETPPASIYPAPTE